MQKDQIAELLESKHQELFSLLEPLDQDQWESGPEGKWSVGQVALHLLQSIKPLNDAMSMPKFILRYKFGKANREVRDYETVINRYNEKLDNVQGGVSPFSKNMKNADFKHKNYILTRLKMENKKLQYKTQKWKDKSLDNLILPHPLMGKMPVREMVMWTAHHVEHHKNKLLQNYIK
jgi:uncharacterized damage-inducible protein DinB